MADLQTSADLLEDALRKSGEKTDGTSEYAPEALAAMNNAYRKLLSGANMFDVDFGDPWPWAKAKYPGVLVLEPSYETGTVSLTADSTTGAFSVAPTVSLAGRYLKVADRPEVFRIATHSALGTAFTLDAPYTDSTGATLSFVAMKLDYDLSAATVLRLIGPFRVQRQQNAGSDGSGQVSGMDKLAFDREFPLHLTRDGVPTRYCQISEVDGLITVRFNLNPGEKMRLEYDYIPTPVALTDSSSSIPLIPDGHRQVLSFMTAYEILADKNDDSVPLMANQVVQALKALKNDSRNEKAQASRHYARLIPRLDQTRSQRWPTQE